MASRKAGSAFLDGQSGAGTITSFDASALATITPAKCRVAMALTARLTRILIWRPRISVRLMTFILFGVAAAQQAVEDSGWMPTEEADLVRTGVLIGSGIGGLEVDCRNRRDD